MIDLSRFPFSYHGSWMSIRKDITGDKLVLRNHHFKAHTLFSLETVVDGQIVEPVIQCTPTRLVLQAGTGSIVICFESPDSIRLRGTGNVALRCATQGIHAYANGCGKAVFNFRKAYRRYQFETLAGELQLTGEYASAAVEQIGEVTSAINRDVERDNVILILPDANGQWELAIDEFWSSWQCPQRQSFETCLSLADAKFQRFADAFTPPPVALIDAHQLAAYTNWSCTVNPAGLVKRPTIFMSKNWMDSVWSWDQCFNAMALASAHPELAIDQMLTEVDHQDAFGAYPDAFNDFEIHYNFSKPPVHGLAFRELLRLRVAPLDRDVLETMIVSLGKQVDWWMTYRVVELESSPLYGLPYYLHGNDSGWDNSTMFDQGVPLVSPDLAALLTTQMDVLSELTADVYGEEVSKKWKDRADALFEKMMLQLWQGDHFSARLAADASVVEAQSLIPWLAIVLGQRLPESAREHLKQGIEQHLTAYGLATERVDSPKYTENGYWRGPIWAPSTFLAVYGLERCGFTDLATTISERFCALCAKSAFAENYDACTGEALCDPFYSWTASVFLLLIDRIK